MSEIGTSGPAVERLAIANDELWCDLLTLMGRASSEGHEAGQRLACEARQKVRYTGETLRALAGERDALRLDRDHWKSIYGDAFQMASDAQADRDAARAERDVLAETINRLRRFPGVPIITHAQSAHCEAHELRADVQALRQLSVQCDRLTAERDAARAEVARLREIAMRLLYVAASEKHDTRTARYLVQHLAWPDDAPSAVHPTLEEARAALAHKDPQP